MNMKNKQKNFENFRLKEEYLFILVALLFGVLFSFLNPPAQSNDEDRHFYNAFSRSEGKMLPEKNGDQVGYMIPKSVIQTISAYQGINFPAGDKILKKTIDNYSEVILSPNNREFYNHPNYSINPIPYLPYMIGINIGKIINSNPMSLLWSARISGLIFYIIIIFFTIRTIPVFKGVVMLLALSPMALYQASSVTYDVMSISLAFLLFSMYVKFALVEKEVTMVELIWLVVAAFFHRFAKDGYILIPFLLLIVPRSRFKNHIIYYALLAFFVILIFLPDWTWGSMLQSANLGRGRALQTDYLFDASKNLSYQLSHPFEMVGHLFLNILSQGKEWLFGTFARFGYAYIMPSHFVITLHILVLLTVALFDSKKEIEISNKVKYITFIIGITSLLLIIGGFFIVGSPVGSSIVFGLQGRYFLPIVPLLLLVIYNTKYYNVNFDKFGAAIIAVYSIIILSYIANFINGYYYAG
jgi:uncharacterized membrane protein